MAPRRLMCALAVLAVGIAGPLAAQLPQPSNAPRTKAPRAPGAPTGKTLARPGQVPSANPPAGGAAGAATAQPTSGGAGAPVTPQSAVTTAAAAPTNAFTAGLALSPFVTGGQPARIEYLRTLARNLDSATVLLVGIYRNTSGQPASGATAPTALSSRERERWTRCRDVYWDFTTFAAGARSAREGLTSPPALVGAVEALDSALAQLPALQECDNLASMISAPARWDPWERQYTNAAHHFYADWYSQVREAHERDRALVVALNALVSAPNALPVPPGMPHNPPYAGADIR